MVLANLGNVSPPLFNLITLITYLIYLTLVLSCPWLGLAYPSPHLTAPGGDLSTYVILSFLSFFVLCTNQFFRLSVREKIWFFWELPPWVLSLTFHFSIFSCPLTLPDFTSASLLHLPVFVSLCSLCSVAAVRVSWTEAESVRFCPPQSLSTIPGHRQSSTLRLSFPPPRPSKRQGTLSFSPLTFPLSPLWSRP